MKKTKYTYALTQAQFSFQDDPGFLWKVIFQPLTDNSYKVNVYRDSETYVTLPGFIGAPSLASAKRIVQKNRELPF